MNKVWLLQRFVKWMDDKGYVIVSKDIIEPFFHLDGSKIVDKYFDEGNR